MADQSPKQRDDGLDAERIERLIASNEAVANAVRRLVQLEESKRERKSDLKANRVRKAPKRGGVITDKAEAAARAAVARAKAGR